jgi:hypothetical protein
MQRSTRFLTRILAAVQVLQRNQRVRSDPSRYYYLVRQGKQAEAEAEARNYIASQTDSVYKYFGSKAAADKYRGLQVLPPGQEFVVGGFAAPKRSRKHLGAVILGALLGVPAASVRKFTLKGTREIRVILYAKDDPFCAPAPALAPPGSIQFL